MKLVAADYAAEMPDLMSQLARPGLLLVVPDTSRPANVMTIGWATFGRVWSRPMCMVMVRPSRYTYGLINRAGVFTVNRMPAGSAKAVARCGAVSGREVDKIAEQGWTLQPGETQPAPYLAEAALHLECRTVFTSEVTAELAEELRLASYPEADYHTLYFGLVTGVYRHE
ncbi:MAG TPA: flavin reductase family protein [Anaerolineae bacterium]|nr:flavin reductase family protein [Anaerolineae bacterium]HPL26736.1 flavin reductase family protein [Anaerolineae bacterium]